MDIVPLQAVQSQIIAVTLGTQLCQLNIYQKSTGLFMDIYVSGVLVLGGVLCHNLNRVVRSSYLGFIGDLAFFDTQGSDDPFWTGLGDRYQLAYLTPTDLLSTQQFPPPGPFTFTTAPSSAFVVDPNVLAIVNAYATTLSGQQIQAINTLVTSLKSAGAWSLFDALYVYAAPDSASALVNWINPGTLNSSLIGGTASFVANVGFSLIGTQQISTNYNPVASGVNFKQNSASIAVWQLNNQQDATPAVGNYNGTTTGATILPCTIGTGVMQGRMNDNTNFSYGSTTPLGLFSLSRTGSATVNAYYNGTQSGGTNTTTSVGVANTTFLIGGNGAAGVFTPGTFAIFWAGGALTPAQELAVYTAFAAYMVAIGAPP